MTSDQILLRSTLTPIHRGEGGLGRNGRPRADTCLVWGWGPAAAERDGRRGAWIPRPHSPRAHRLACAVGPAVSVSPRAEPPQETPRLAVGPGDSPQLGRARSRFVPFRFRLPVVEAG